ncbi:hypothetical protein T4E_11758 [Trichinella pseudospiralis]|uniref:Uncharacterized protein n=1 Tax=Trichinella pseudospiralis TaxID=6337 RepID=A0A0V0X9I4_TRIPS|nr:hypothetical protein T4E_11758 [Trichinella pseudospiralis]
MSTPLGKKEIHFNCREEHSLKLDLPGIAHRQGQSAE